MAGSHFLACVIVTSCAVSGLPAKYALKGELVNLTSGFTLQPDQILWKRNGNKVVEFNGNEELVFDPFKDRITLDWRSAQLTISNLRLEDGGVYELEVSVKGKWQNSFSELVVLDWVPKPSISCEMTDGGGSNASGTLVCNAEHQLNNFTSIGWISQGDAGVTTGTRLKIPLGDTFKDLEYICQVSNPLSSETATYTAKDCKADNGSSTALIASLVPISIIILLVLLGILLYLKQKHKACFTKRSNDDLERQGPTGRAARAGTAEAEERVPLFDRAPTFSSNQPIGHLTQGSDNGSATDDERRTVLERAPTLPSTQSLGYLHQLNAAKDMNKEKEEKEASPPPTQRSESPSDLDRNCAAFYSGDAVSLQRREPSEKEILECSNVPDPVAVTADINDDTASEPESINDSEPSEKEILECSNVPDPVAVTADINDDTASEPESINDSEPSEKEIPECSNLPDPVAVEADINEDTASEPGSINDSDNQDLNDEAEKDEEAKSHPRDGIPPAAHPPSTSSQNSPRVTATDVPGEHDEDSDDSREDDYTNFPGTDSSGIVNANESDDTSEDEEQPSTIPEQGESEKNPHDEELNMLEEKKHTDGDNKQVMDKAVSDSEGDGEESEEEHDLYLASSETPPSPTSPEPDRNSRSSLEFAQAAKTGPEKEEKAEMKDESDEDEDESDEVSEDEGLNQLSDGSKKKKSPAQESFNKG